MSALSALPITPGTRKPAAAVSDENSELPILQELAARHLEASGRFRILRRVPERTRINLDDALRMGHRIGAIVDTETTGLDHRIHQVIEFAAVLFAFGGDGALHGIVDEITEFGQPSEPLRPEITRLTGISDGMVAGKSIDRSRIARFIEPAQFIVAHNAGFDRPFCEGLADAFRTTPWACSVRDVDWGDAGRGGLKLAQLLAESGYFHNGHRALDDAIATLEILASTCGRASPPLVDICRAVSEARIEVRAEQAPYEAKEILKGRGYRWFDGTDGRTKCWCREIPEDAFAAETSFLRSEVYRGAREPAWRRLDATSRYR